MSDPDNPYAQSDVDAISVPAADCLLVDGNVNLGTDKGSGQILWTRDSVFAFRTHVSAAMTGVAVGGLIGALIGRYIDKKRAASRPAPEHLDDPEIQRLDEATRKKIATSSLLVKLPLNQSLTIERTRLGFKISDNVAQHIVFQGFMHKNKISDYLTALGIDAR